MIRITVKTNVANETIVKAVTSTPKEVFNELGIDYAGKSVNVNGTPLTGDDINETFEELGVSDGTEVRIHAIVKADAGCRE